MAKPTDAMILLGYLVLPRFGFAECPGSLGVPGVHWIDMIESDLGARMDMAFTPIFVCLGGVNSFV